MFSAKIALPKVVFKPAMAFTIRNYTLLAACAVVGTLVGCSQAPMETTKTSPPVAATSSGSNKPISQESANCFIDSQKRNPDSLVLLGWAFGNISEQPQSIYVKVSAGGKDTEFPTKIYDRPDIAKGFKSPVLIKSGFIANIPVKQIPEGSEFSILVQGSSEMFVCKNIFKAH